MLEKDDTFMESTEEYETRCFLNIYKELKDPSGMKLSTDRLLRLLQQRFNLPKARVYKRHNFM